MKSKFAIMLLILGVSLAFILPGYGKGRRQDAPVRLTVRVRHVFAGRPLRLNALALHTQAGNTLSVSRLAYLVSGVTLLRAGGVPISLDGQFAYLNPGADHNAFTLQDVPPGHYAGLRFCIGLPASINHADPALYPAGHALHPLVNHLHWGWQGGYVFLALEGRYAQAGGRIGGYVYHLATDAHLMTVTLPRDFELKGDTRLDLEFDAAKIFDTDAPILITSLNSGDSSHSAPGDTLAPRLKTNVEHAFAIVDVTTANTTALNAPTVTPSQSATKPFAASSRIASHTLTTPYVFPAPAHFPAPMLPADNPLTVQGVALGKRLFFDPRLSGNNTQSCASCHQPRYAFANGGRAFSVGIDGRPGTRRALPLFNLAWQQSFGWDGKRTRLRDQVLAPIQDTREMHQTLARALAKLQADTTYPILFNRAFGSPRITSERLGLAVEQYLYTLVSADARFDRALKGEAQFTEEEKRGLLLFITEYDPARGQWGADCFHCHGGNLFTDYAFKNNGIDSLFKDRGRGGITGDVEDRGKFKTPSLRNVELTGPYMHDGRFKTLEAVVAHYNIAAHRSDTLDPNIAKHPDEGIRLSDSDQKALVAFLKTLTDERWRIHKAAR